MRVSTAYPESHSALLEAVPQVISCGETVTFTIFKLTEVWAFLSPDSRKRKFYGPGVSFGLEIDLLTGDRLQLIQIIN